jgi:hypothetical protein
MDNLLKAYKSYDIENDSDAYGRSLVDRVYRKYGTFEIEEIIEQQKNLDKWKAIAFKKFPPLLPREIILVTEVKERLKKLKQAGYEIKPKYHQLKKKEIWAYFREIKKNITHKLNSPIFG